MSKELIEKMSDERWQEILRRNTGSDAGAMWSACGEYNCGCHEERSELIQEIQRLKALVGGWIPVSERLPDEAGRYLVQCRTVDGADDEQDVFGYRPGFHDETWMEYIIAWRHLLPPYHQEEKDGDIV